MLENYAKKRAVKNCLKRTSNKNTGLWNEHDFAAIRTMNVMARNRLGLAVLCKNFGHVVKMTIFLERLFISVMASSVVNNTTIFEHINY